MYIDTHCHLNFKAFERGEAKIVRRAKEAGVESFVVPGTDIATSRTAVTIAQTSVDAFAVVGIHPHHASQYQGDTSNQRLREDIAQIEGWLYDKKVVGIGEVGLDRHAYSTSRYGPLISVSDELFGIQKILFIEQVALAVKYHKSIVIHNREAVDDILDLFHSLGVESRALKGRGVFHCCEPDQRLLSLAKEVNFYIGVDGDVTFSPEKQQFIQDVPLEMLVLETDSPYLLPEPLKSAKKYPNTPANIPFIAQFVAQIKGVGIGEVADVTTRNARRLFRLPE